jgi:hypothetical protein
VSVDLDAARRARAERLGNPKAVVGGRSYALRGDFPVRSAIAFSRLIDSDGTPLDERDALLREVVEGLLVDPSEVDAFLANRISIFDISDVINDYGTSVGESSASSTSSNGSGKPSRPTSKRTTKSTSSKRSGAKKR